MKFHKRKAYGHVRYYPIDMDALELISIFKSSKSKTGHQVTLTEDQYNVLSKFGIKFDLTFFM